MRIDFFLLGIYLFVNILNQSNASNKCYYAKTCIHDGTEKCGQNSQSKIRRFLDSCDMKEYNCLKETDYRKIPSIKCRNLPPLDDKPLQNKENESDEGNDSIDRPNEAAGVSDSADVDNEAHGTDDSHKIQELNERNDYIEGLSHEVDDVQKSKQLLELETEVNNADIQDIYDPEKINALKAMVETNQEERSNEIETMTMRTIHPGKAAVINEYWCWRARYCHKEGSVVCGRDRRQNKRQKFKSACDLYTHNCEEGHDFTATDLKLCKRH